MDEFDASPMFSAEESSSDGDDGVIKEGVIVLDGKPPKEDGSKEGKGEKDE